MAQEEQTWVNLCKIATYQ